MAERKSMTKKAAAVTKAAAAPSFSEPEKITFEVLVSICGMIKGEKRTVTKSQEILNCEKAGYIRIL